MASLLGFCFLLGAVGCQPVARQELVLVDEGVARMPIVVFENAPPFTRQAADELAEYIEKTSGARPEVIEGCPDPVPENAIWVGYQPQLDKLFPDIDFNFQNPEEILIAANENHLVIAGRDVWNPEHLLVELRLRRPIDGVQQEYGTVNAVYTFLQDWLGVRWLWPGELGEDILEQKTISFAPFQYRYHPQFRARSGTFIIYMLNRQHLGHEWARLQRMQLDSMDIYGGHPFTDYWERFHATNPEFFALQPDGTRGGGAEPWPSAIMVKTCKSNPEVWQQWLADVEAKLERNPNATVFEASANDGWREGYCICENCRNWDHPDAPEMLFNWHGLGQQYVSMTERQITFANQLGRLLRERFPDKDYYVMAMAYGNSTHPPVAVVPDDNVLVASVHSFHRTRGIHPRTGVDQRQTFIEYAKKVPRMIWRPNIGQGSGWHIGFPVVAPRRAIEDLRLVADNNVVGLWYDSIFGHWANQGLHYYMLAQLAWNPRADGEEILDDYMRRAYGPAADTMRAYWDLLEQTTLAMTFEDKPEEEVWDAAFHQTANQFLDQAIGELADAPPKYAQRVAFARTGLDYLRLLQENRELMKAWHASENKDTAARDAAAANWEQVEKMIAANPFLLNSSYVHRGAHRYLGRFLPPFEQ